MTPKKKKKKKKQNATLYAPVSIKGIIYSVSLADNCFRLTTYQANRSLWVWHGLLTCPFGQVACLTIKIRRRRSSRIPYSFARVCFESFPFERSKFGWFWEQANIARVQLFRVRLVLRRRRTRCFHYRRQICDKNSFRDRFYYAT